MVTRGEINEIIGYTKTAMVKTKRCKYCAFNHVPGRGLKVNCFIIMEMMKSTADCTVSKNGTCRHFEQTIQG